MIEQFSVGAASTAALSFEQDIDVRVEAHVGGMGIDESKLGSSSDPVRLAEFYRSGLRGTLAVPTLPSILPSIELFPGAEDGPPAAERYVAEPSNRLALMASSIRRLAAFDPVAIGVQAGASYERSPDETRTLIAQGLRMLARTATKLHPRPLQIALEPVAPEWAEHGWAVTSLSEAADLIDEADEPNLKIVLDTWHQSAVTADEIGKFVDRIVLVQLAERDGGALASPGVSDRRNIGAGQSDSAATVRALTDAGYRGWYELDVPLGSDTRSAVDAMIAARTTFRALYRELSRPLTPR